MELARNPLNSKLLEQQNSSADENGKEEFAHNVDGMCGSGTRIPSLPCIDQEVEGDPNGNCPGGESDVSVLWGRVRRNQVKADNNRTYAKPASNRCSVSC
jgi:hypothetical protein